MTSPINAALNASTAKDQPAIIATRQHCEAEGVGLSHYILMDRAAPAAPAESPVAAA